MFAFGAWRALQWRRTRLVLTNHRLIYGSGVITRHTREIALTQVTDVSVLQTVLGRVLKYGDLVVQTAGEAGRPFPFFGVPDPEGLRAKMLQQLRAQAGGTKDLASEVALAVSNAQPTREVVAIPPERPPLYSEIVDQIERLDTLRVRGVLSEEEFQRAKEGLIDRLSGEAEGEAGD